MHLHYTRGLGKCQMKLDKKRTEVNLRSLLPHLRLGLSLTIKNTYFEPK